MTSVQAGADCVFCGKDLMELEMGRFIEHTIQCEKNAVEIEKVLFGESRTEKFFRWLRGFKND